MSSTPLRQQVAGFSYEELSARQLDVAKALNAASQEQDALKFELHQVKVSIRAREQALMLERGGNLPRDDKELNRLYEQKQDARQRLASLPTQAESLHTIANALRDEIATRNSELKVAMEKKCREGWKPAEFYINAARKVLAEGLLALHHERTERPGFLDSSMYITSYIQPLEVQRVFQELVSKEKTAAKAQLIAENSRWGA